MSADIEVTSAEIGKLYETLKKEAEASGYHLGTDVDFTKELLKGLLMNQKRYGYQACPCRLASGNKDEDLDIICPCDYRDPDLDAYGCCYCGLYVSQEVVSGQKSIKAIPERRPPPGQKKKNQTTAATATIYALPLPVWRCRVCGYLCARDAPPEVCPICKARKERFERFI